MKKSNDTFFTDDKIYSFIDRRTTADEDKLFFARMAKEEDFANMIEDLMDAVNSIAESDKTEMNVTFDYSRTALAAFCDTSLEVKSNTNYDINASIIPTRQVQDMADDFLNSLEDNKPEGK